MPVWRIPSIILALTAMAFMFWILPTGANVASVHAQTPPTPEAATEQPGGLGDEEPQQVESKINPPKYPQMDSDLNRLVQRHEIGGFTARAAAAAAPVHRGESVAVTLHVAEGYTDAVVEFLEANGGTARNVGKDFIEAYVPVSLLPEASTQEGVIGIQAIVPPQPEQGVVVSEGAAAHGIIPWRNAGYRGQGVKVGVIDTGFEGFRGLMGTELPSNVQARCYTDIGIFTSNISDCMDEEDRESRRKHGTAVTEAIFDIAPEATYYISKPASRGDLRKVVDWMVDQEVDVINYSVSWTWDGPGDGSSPFSRSPLRSVDAAVEGGVVWVNSAGNNARRTWYGPFTDTDADGRHDFAADDECNTVELSADHSYVFQLRWNDTWGGANTDLDILLVPAGDSRVVAGGSGFQTGEPWHDPYEFFSFVPDQEGEYCLYVHSLGAAAPSWIQIQVWGIRELEHHTLSGSITNPGESANAGLLAVGAAPWSDTHTIEPFSSRGPTPDGRTKPDIVGTDAGRSVTYGTFYGTSQASPHVAGLAALVLQRFPDLTPERVADYLKNSAESRGDGTLDNTWGEGFARLPAPAEGESPPESPDRAALEALYHATGGPDWTVSMNWMTNEPLHSWAGVGTNLQNRVTALDLRVNGLSGEIPADLGDLSALTRLFLTRNELTGEIPTGLGDLLNLRLLSLSSNRLTGGIPAELGNLSDLTGLYLWGNELTGEIPHELGELSKLERLYLDQNQLTGEVPPELGNLTNLEYLYLYRNALEGELPQSFTDLDALENFAFDSNAGLCAPVNEEFQDWLQAIPNDSLPQDATPLGPNCQESAGSIVFGDLNWRSAMLQNRIAQYIAEYGYGYSTDVEFGATGALFQELRSGNIDVLMEVWLPNQQESLDEALAEGAVSSPGSSLGTDWQSAFVIPAYLQELYPDLDSVEDLKEEQYRSLFTTDDTGGKARLMSCVIGWPCAEVNTKQVEGYGQSDHVHIVNPDSLEALNADIYEAYENREPWLGFQWGTNDPALLLDLVRLEEPAYSDECWATTMACAYEDATILIAVNAGLSESADDFVDMLMEWDFNVDGNYKPAFRWLSANPEANLEDAALWWLRGNSDVWSEWVTADADAAIRDALGSGEIPDGWPQDPNNILPAPLADACVHVQSEDDEISGEWSDDCASDSREGRYARYYSFYLTESADLTVTLESTHDTYLYLHEGWREDGLNEGAALCENDDYASVVTGTDTSCRSIESDLGSDTDSGLSASLRTGTYTIEATTYDEDVTGEFTLIISGLPVAATPTPEPSPDRAVLVALYNATDGDNWTDKENWLSDEPLSEWHGITTDDDGRVTQISLRENNLIGSIPSEVGNLTNLTRLILAFNQLSGTIPIELADLSNLEALGLQENELSGEIPTELGSLSNLTALSLRDNQLNGEIPHELSNLSDLEGLYLLGNNLSGEIPTELGDLSNLKYLFLGENELSGEIPSELGDLTNLEYLNLQENEMSGGIPAELGSLVNLKELDLDENQLSGEIPTELGNLANLTVLDLSWNELSGEIPADLSSLANLEELDLGGNELDGEIPSELGGLSNLVELELYENQLTGEIPSELGDLSNLTVLSLVRNQLNGEIPSELGSLSNLTGLYLWGNKLSGEIPAELGNLSSLTVLELPGNELSGEIPAELGSLANLEELDLGGNELDGEIPAELGNLSSLTVLELPENELSGEIPTEFGNLSKLEVLSLWGNELSGEIPSELGNLLSLVELYLDVNQLSGKIPAELGNLANLKYLNLTWNQLSGEIPAELGRLENLSSLALGGNQLSGEIPPELGNLSNLTELYIWGYTGGSQVSGGIPSELSNLSNLRVLYLYSNQLSGEIPSELGRLINLTRLELGRNQLSGAIPSEIGSLVNLQQLSFSGNQLSGEIPSELGNLTSLTNLYLRENGLSGEIPSELGRLTNLEVLALERNQLGGEIPSEVLSLPSLRRIYLWGNQLHGAIPSHTSEVAVLSNLYNATGGAEWTNNDNWVSTEPIFKWFGVGIDTSGRVTALLLRNNQLSGEIPPELGNLTSLILLSLSRNQLTGEIPSELSNLEDLEALFLAGNQLSGCIPSGLEEVPDNDLYDLGLEFCSDEN